MSQLALTPDEWRKLPSLLPRSIVMEWTGLSSRQLSDMVAAGQIGWLRGRGRKGKFFKSEVARYVRVPV